MAKYSLEEISQNVLENEPKGIAGYEVNERGIVTINLKDGSTLNELLPEGKFISNEKESPPRIMMDSIIIDVNYLENPHYVAGLAHEFGHIYDPEAEDLAHQRVETMFTGWREGMSVEERLNKLTEAYQLEMQEELNAWDVGKIIADKLNVEESIYEDLRITGLEAHFSGKLYYFNQDIEKYCGDIKDTTEIKIFDPFVQDYKTISYGEFKKVIPRFEDWNDKVFKEFKHKTGMHN